MRNRLIILALLCLATLGNSLGMGRTAWAGEAAKEIVAVGVADGQSAKARDEALSDAMRRAVEQGVGSFLTSETTVEQMVLVEDRVYSESKGYIKSYTIIREGAKDNLYEIKISAIVLLDQLAKDLEAIGILIKKKSNPRVMVVIYSRETSTALFGVSVEGNRTAENQIESILLRKGFQLVDAGQVRRKKELETLFLKNDPSMASKIAKDFGAEVLVEGEIRRTFTEERKVMGRSMRFFSNEIRLKAFETDTAKILYSGFQTRPPSGGEANLPLEEATSELTNEMIAGILGQWRKDVYQAGSFQLNIKGATFGDLSRITDGLRQIRGLDTVQVKNFQSGIAHLDLQFKGTALALGEKIAQLKDLPLELVGIQANIIDFEWQKPPISTPPPPPSKKK